MTEENENTSLVVGLSRTSKFLGGFFLIFFTLLALFIIIAYWPDRLPASGDKIARYNKHWFNVDLLDSNCIKKQMPCNGCVVVNAQGKQVIKNEGSVKPTADSTLKDTSLKKDVLTPIGSNKNIAEDNLVTEKIDIEDTIQFNTLLLILVAAAGFLGNMIHVATSFTAFIGAEQFKKSWILWYCVKPFTAAALAIAVYFAFRAGFISNTDAASNVNLYGVMTFAILTGLFTDSATQKLKEIFEVIFKPKDIRPDKIDNIKNLALAQPDKIDINNPNKFVITGNNLDKTKLSIKINNVEVVGAVITGSSINFTYTVTDKTQTTFKLRITDEQGNDVLSKDLGI